MTERKENGGVRHLGGLLILCGLVLLVGCLLLLTHNLRYSTRAAESSQAVMTKLLEQRPPLRLPEQTMPPLQGGVENPAEPLSPEETPEPTMPTVTVDGYDYIGSLTFPSLELELPVMAEWDYTRLNISPCLFSGSYYSNDLVICAHNYARHFSPLWRIPMGEEVFFTASDGTVYHYVITKRETIQPDDVSGMIGKPDSEAGDWDLTLFTCYFGGQTRCAVRCVRVEA